MFTIGGENNPRELERHEVVTLLEQHAPHEMENLEDLSDEFTMVKDGVEGHENEVTRYRYVDDHRRELIVKVRGDAEGPDCHIETFYDPEVCFNSAPTPQPGDEWAGC